MSEFLVFDIETIVDTTLPIHESHDGASLPPSPYHQVVAIGAFLLTDAGLPIRLGIVAEGKPESEQLAEFVRVVSKREVELITYNGRGFDLPVIAARCLRHGIPFPAYYRRRDFRYRFSPDGHLDLMDFLADYGATRATKLDVVAKLIGMAGKVGVEGKDVGPMVAAGRLKEVQDYCLCDVVQTAAVFLRLQLLRGELDRTQYLAAATALLDFIDADVRLASVGAAVDRQRLLLG